VSDTESEFLELFRDEANERLDNMVDNLLALESGRAEPDALDALFRDAHTIKGGAGMLGLDDVRTLAHAVEDVLGSVREAGVFPPELADPLLRAADALRKHVAGDGEGTPDLLDELAASVASVTGGEAPAASASTAPAPAPSERRAIRVPPQKIDRLLDLVGETVLHRRRLEHLLGVREARQEPGVVRRLQRLPDVAVRLALEPGEVREHPAQCRLPVMGVWQVLRERVVEAELAGLAQLHDRGRREGLRDRADAVLGLGGRLALVLDARVADRVGPQHLPLADDRGTDTREPFRLCRAQERAELLRDVLRRGQEPRAPGGSARRRARRRRRRCRGA